MTFRVEAFMERLTDGCESAARTFGLRQWDPNEVALPLQPFPESFAVAEAVRKLQGTPGPVASGFRVMPEVVRHEVLRRLGVGPDEPDEPGLKAENGRYDLVAWGSDKSPLAAVEFKWQWGNHLADVENLQALARHGVHGFMCLLGVDGKEKSATDVLTGKIEQINPRGRVRFGKPLLVHVTEAGRVLAQKRGFQAAVVEIKAE